MLAFCAHLQTKLKPACSIICASLISMGCHQTGVVCKWVQRRHFDHIARNISVGTIIDTGPISSLNDTNPIVDRIMEDESVEGVVVTNREGHPIFTNINLLTASMYGNGIHLLGHMSKYSVSEIDPFDEVLVIRLKTKKMEVMIAPHQEFNIAIIQHGRSSKKIKKPAVK